MNYAVNKEAIIQNVLFGNGEMATSFLPMMPGRDPNSPGYPLRSGEGQGASRRVPPGRTASRPTTSHCRGRCRDASRPSSSLRTWLGFGGTINVAPIDGNTLLENLFTTFDFDLSAAYYTTDIIDPDEMASFAVFSRAVLAP